MRINESLHVHDVEHDGKAYRRKSINRAGQVLQFHWYGEGEDDELDEPIEGEELTQLERLFKALNEW